MEINYRTRCARTDASAERTKDVFTIGSRRTYIAVTAGATVLSLAGSLSSAVYEYNVVLSLEHGYGSGRIPESAGQRRESILVYNDDDDDEKK